MDEMERSATAAGRNDILQGPFDILDLILSWNISASKSVRGYFEARGHTV